MTWQVVMDEDGCVTLPADLIALLGWTPETILHWTDEEGGVGLAPASPGSNETSR